MEKEVISITEEDLQAKLLYLLRYGHPRLSHMRTGWNCTVEMNTSSAGSDFRVSSGFNHKNPISAVLECEERITESIKKYSSHHSECKRIDDTSIHPQPTRR